MILITHYDLDGAGCAIVAKWHNPAITVLSSSYKKLNAKILDAIQKDSEVVLSDISPEQDLPEEAWDHITVYDHHKNSFFAKETMAGRKLCQGVFAPDKCGTEIMAEAYPFVPTASKMDFVNAVSAWDLWKLSDPCRTYGENLDKLFWFEGFERFVEERLESVLITDHEIWTLSVIKEQNLKYIADRVSSAVYYRDQNDLRVALIMASQLQGEIAESVGKDLVDYIAVVNSEHDVVSLRSDGKTNVGKIAQQLGGGGHDRAAGFSGMDSFVKTLKQNPA